MKVSLGKALAGVGAAAVVVVGLVVVPGGAVGASQVVPAVVPPGQVVIAAAGADATVKVMDPLLSGTNQFNIPTLPATPFAVPGDANCSDLAYVQSSPGAGQVIAPVSAGTGLDALKAQEANPAGQKGCIDIARSSAPPRGLAKDPATFEYYAFALDAVSWASPSLAAPATLTKQNLKDIYACNITDWSQVPGGGSGPIQRYFTQIGSGTGSFFISDLLDGQDPTLVSSPSCPAVKRIQQSEGTQIAAADHESAILPYSGGDWTFQANNHLNPTIDVRNGAKLGGIISASATNANIARWNSIDVGYELNTGTVTTTPVNEANVKLNSPTPDFPGVRYVFNTIDTASPNYAEAAAVVGFTNVPGGAKSPLCSGAKRTTILSYGFASLSAAGNPGASNPNLAGATCRKYTN